MRTALALLICVHFGTAIGQVITVVRNGQSFFHYDISQLSTLISTNSPAHTLPGDTIILPGAAIWTPNIVINKPLTIVGAGVIPSGATVTGLTILNSTTGSPGQPLFTIVAEGAGSSFHGIVFQMQVRFFGFNLNTPSFSATFERCLLNNGLSLVAFMSPSQAPPASNVTVRQSIIRNGISNSSTLGPSGFQVLNSFIVGSVNITGNNFATNTFVNQSIVLGPGTQTSNGGVVFTNSIFARTTGTYSYPSSYATFSNNLFGTSSGAPPSFGPNVTQSGNQSAANTLIFQNVTEWNDFNGNFNYQLPVSSPAVGIGLGGYNAGVYGGPPGNPWKELAIPFNPHWQELLPLGTLGVTQGGTINVTIQGAAQQN